MYRSLDYRARGCGGRGFPLTGGWTLGLNLEDKKAVVAEVSAEVARAQAIVLAENRGLEVGQMTELRKRARGAGIYFRVVKNTLARRAVADTPFAELADQMVGPLAYGMSSDPVALAKVLHGFAKGNEKLAIKGGAMATTSCPRRMWPILPRCEPRGAARQAARHHAGACRAVRADAERGAFAPGSDPRRSARCERSILAASSVPVSLPIPSRLSNQE